MGFAQRRRGAEYEGKLNQYGSSSLSVSAPLRDKYFWNRFRAGTRRRRELTKRYTETIPLNRDCSGPAVLPGGDKGFFLSVSAPLRDKYFWNRFRAGTRRRRELTKRYAETIPLNRDCSGPAVSPGGDKGFFLSVSAPLREIDVFRIGFAQRRRGAEN
jgi:hypothetical protein